MGRRARPRTDFRTVVLGVGILLAAAGAQFATHLAIGGFSQLTRMFRPSRLPPPPPFDPFDLMAGPETAAGGRMPPKFNPVQPRLPQ